MSGPGRVCPDRAGRPGSLGIAGRGSLISPGVVGRGARVGDPVNPAHADTPNPHHKKMLTATPEGRRAAAAWARPAEPPVPAHSAGPKCQPAVPARSADPNCRPIE